MSEQERLVHEIFTEAIELPPSEWPGLLIRRCNTPELRARVQTLLNHHVSSGEFLSRPAVNTFSGVAGTLGSQIAEFKIIREIGRGGMGVVYLAEDTVLRRAIALKVLSPQPDDESPGDRFRKEAQAVARLSHPGIVQIYRSGEERGYAYIAMEYIEGETLRAQRAAEAPANRPALHATRTGWPWRLLGRAWIGPRSAPLSPDGPATASARVALEIAEALDHAHRQGVIHRDVKPSNILMGRDGRARLADFGVARIVTEKTFAGPGDLAGSYPYMSPEQALIHKVEIDHRTDIFSLGVVLYEMLTNVRPFDGDTPQEILRALGESQPRQVRQLNPAIPMDLATICHKAIEKHPNDRYQTAAHMAADLRCLLDWRPILATPPSAARKARRWVIRRRAPLLYAAAAFLFALCLLLLGQREIGRRTSLARVSISLAEPADGAETYLERWDPVRRTFGPRASLGTLPIEGRRVEPGLYRLIVLGAGGDFAESDLILTKGATVSHSVWLRESGACTKSMLLFENAIYVPPGDQGSTEVQRLAPFWLDAAEVTNRQYRAFVEGTGHEEPEFWKPAGSFETIADLPVVDVPRASMQAYAVWAGKRLPTEAEWVAAALAPDGRTPPWGLEEPPESFTPGREMLLADQDTRPERQIPNYVQFVRPAGSLPSSRSRPGLVGMFGNVMEMTATVVVDGRGTNAVVAGGYWLHDPKHFDLSRTTLFPSVAKSTQIGFRCAKSVSAPAVAASSP